eukprot:Rhum_TRINITY_DN15212_c17_g1::Rhum_TRINITY_DN15212_c17_g1_i1::g.144906::m.144906
MIVCSCVRVCVCMYFCLSFFIFFIFFCCRRVSLHRHGAGADAHAREVVTQHSGKELGLLGVDRRHLHRRLLRQHNVLRLHQRRLRLRRGAVGEQHRGHVRRLGRRREPVAQQGLREGGVLRERVGHRGVLRGRRRAALEGDRLVGHERLRQTRLLHSLDRDEVVQHGVSRGSGLGRNRLGERAGRGLRHEEVVEEGRGQRHGRCGSLGGAGEVVGHHQVVHALDRPLRHEEVVQRRVGGGRRGRGRHGDKRLHERLGLERACGHEEVVEHHRGERRRLDGRGGGDVGQRLLRGAALDGGHVPHEGVLEGHTLLALKVVDLHAGAGRRTEGREVVLEQHLGHAAEDRGHVHRRGGLRGHGHSLLHCVDGKRVLFCFLKGPFARVLCFVYVFGSL